MLEMTKHKKKSC